MRPFVRSALATWVLVIAATALAAGLTSLLSTEGGRIFPFFSLAVVASAWLAGRTAGFLTTGLSAAAATWLFLPPFGSLEVRTTANVVALAVFLVVGFLISLLAAGRRHAADARAVSSREMTDAF